MNKRRRHEPYRKIERGQKRGSVDKDKDKLELEGGQETPAVEVEPEGGAPGDQEPQEVPELQEPPAEVVEPPAEPVVPVGDEKPTSRRESLRIQKLLEKLHEKDSPRTDLPPAPKGVDYRQKIEGDDALFKELEDDRRKYGEELYNRGLEATKSAEFRMKLEIDAPQVASKHPQFDQNSDRFNPTLAAAVNQWYLSTTKFDPETGKVGNPNIRYSEFVDSVIELADELASSKSAETVKNVAAQAATTGLRPGGSTAKLNLNKEPHEMTDQELDAALASMIKK